jgi:hypothetical protein
MDFKFDSSRPEYSGIAGGSDAVTPGVDLFRPHPNLSDRVNHNIALAEIAGGVRLDRLPGGTQLEIETRNRFYTLEYRRDSSALLCGHPLFCPRPTLVEISGSTWGGSMIWAKYIGREMHLEFIHPDYGRIITSRIVEIRVLDEDHPPARRVKKTASQLEFN